MTNGNKPSWLVGWDTGSAFRELLTVFLPDGLSLVDLFILEGQLAYAYAKKNGERYYLDVDSGAWVKCPTPGKRACSCDKTQCKDKRDIYCSCDNPTFKTVPIGPSSFAQVCDKCKKERRPTG